MKLSVPFNMDQELLEGLKAFSNIDNIYASEDSSVIGNARPTCLLPKADIKYISFINKMAEKNGFTFNYIINAPCFENMEYNRDFIKSAYKHIKDLAALGIKSMTLSNPYLIDFIKKNIPEIKIKVSVISGINDVSKAKIYENSGADTLVLDLNINRDFRILSEIRKQVKCDLELLVNEPCMYRCPYKVFHYNLMGHASQTNSRSKGFFFDYYYACCSSLKYIKPVEFIKSRWIRPEDTDRYSDLGITRFKIAGRMLPSDVILKMVSAYSQKSYEGNLLDIISFMETTRKVKLSKRRNIFGYISKLNLPQLKYFLKWQFLALKINEHFFIDNKKLDNFIDHFIADRCKNNCNDCSYCQKWLKRAVIKHDEVFIKRYLDCVEKVKDSFLKNY